MKALTPAKKASLGMTAVLCIAVAAGGGSALLNSHTPRVSAVSSEELGALAALEPAPPPVPDEASTSISGSVLETAPASKYTYLRLQSASGEVWAAVPSASVALGARVTIENATRMTAFKSATLGRTFDAIYFGTLAGSAATVAAPRFSPADVLGEDQQDLPPGHPDIGSSEPGSAANPDVLPTGHPNIEGAASPHSGVGSAPAEPLLAVPIAPAQGRNAHVISELSTQRARLAGQRIRVRGQVTKVTPDVQGHTFFHLRDGKPGAPSAAVDLVVTSSATPDRGQIATFEGTLRADIDIGIGYRYPILLEDAVIVPE